MFRRTWRCPELVIDCLTVQFYSEETYYNTNQQYIVNGNIYAQIYEE